MSAGLKDLVAGEQVHGTKIRVVDNNDRGRGARNYQEAIPETDALITAKKGVVLSSYYADCTPLFFLAPDIPAIGLAHAGWRGTINKIGQKTVLKMKEVFDIELANLLVGIGPHINSCCYEVSNEVIDKCKKSFKNWRSLVKIEADDKFKLDLAAANRLQLEEVGVKSENIVTSDLCTSCEKNLFYSYRRDNGKTGRMASLIKLR